MAWGDSFWALLSAGVTFMVGTWAALLVIRIVKQVSR